MHGRFGGDLKLRRRVNCWGHNPELKDSKQDSKK